MTASAIALQAGIVGAGGAGFPTHIKFTAKADSFIVNAAECEPLMEVDKFLIRTRADDLVNGAVDIAREIGAAQVAFAIKKAYVREIACLNSAIERLVKSSDEALPDVLVFGMKSFYPAGDEQIITKLVSGKSVPERGIPPDVGVMIDNVATVLNYSDAKHGKPVTHRVLSVAGAVKRPLVLRVPIGTPVRLCVEAAGGAPDGYTVVMGGPMMGKFYGSSDLDSLYVKKTDGGILVLPPGHKLHAMAVMDISKMKNRANAACIKCRMCTDLCPRYLIGHNIMPHVIMQNFYRFEGITDNEEFERVFGSAANCCECGVCENYSCPMMLSPRHIAAYAKRKLSERGINPARNMNPEAREFFSERLAPVDRLKARLGLSWLSGHVGDELTELNPRKVTIALKQSIGAPCVPSVSEGTSVSEGDLIGSPPENKLGARLHASISGKVLSIEKDAIIIGEQ
ncbi:MAG: SLBB domain-containing protein [Oscillospiraceae bacterium]|nr:SLBB domain-containing protein [Oscillospiraceae bacterium]